MKRAIIIFAALALTAFCATAQMQIQPPTEEETLVVNIGEVAPDFSVTMNDGTMVRLSDLRGKVVLLTFWATWCPDCLTEMQYLNSYVLPRLEEEPFVFLPISTRERGDQKMKVEGFLAQNGYKFMTGLDDGYIYKLYTTNFVPRNFLIDRDGKIIATSTDVNFKEKVLDKLFEVIEMIKKTM